MKIYDQTGSWKKSILRCLFWVKKSNGFYQAQSKRSSHREDKRKGAMGHGPFCVWTGSIQEKGGCEPSSGCPSPSNTNFLRQARERRNLLVHVALPAGYRTTLISLFS